MAELVVMPKLGLLMETGVVSEWTVSEGDAVSVGDVIAEIMTEKITYELEAQAEGVLLKIILPEEEEAEVGAPIAVIGRPGEDISAFGMAPAGEGVADAAAGGAAAPGVMAGIGAATDAATDVAPGGRIVASPAAKKLAVELGVDLAAVAGTGPGGRITLEDVNAAAASTAPTPKAPGIGVETRPAVTTAFATPVAKKVAAELGVGLAGVTGSGTSGRIRADDVVSAARQSPAAVPLAAAAVELRGGVAQEIPYAGVRRLIGEHMDVSRKLAPQVTYHALADVQDVRHMLTRVNVSRTEDNKINITSVVIKEVALTLKRMPRFNASLDGDVIKVWRSINIGVAVALPDGLIVPVIREADRKSISEIAQEVRDLAGRARQNKLLPDEVSSGTFTVTTLGSYRSVDFFSPIINQPEAAILGVGRMQDTVVAVDGAPAVRATMGLSLTCDHRMLDGAPAAEFLRTLLDYLADPFSIFSVAI